MGNNLEKLKAIQNALNAKYLERETQVEGMLVALLAQEHMLMVGPPGTAKSALSNELAGIIDGSNYFQWLLTKYTTPDEVFGGIMLKDMEQGIYRHNTTAKMAEAHLVFLDEIFKGSSEILNALLKSINERIFENGTEEMAMPLMTLVGASNEYPEEDEGLEALFDRFLLRFEVDAIKDRQNLIAMMKGTDEEQVMPRISLDELENLQFIREMVEIPADIYETLADIWEDLRDEGIQPSDRRLQKSYAVLQAKALIEQRHIVDKRDILFLAHVLWENVDQRQQVTDIIRHHAQDPVSHTLEIILEDAQDIMDGVAKGHSTDNVLEATQKIKSLAQELTDLKTKYPERENELNTVHETLKQDLEELTNSVLEPIES
ncbi:AAA family ATPase [Lentibacillus sp. CBA3610]|uniref:AAA family ATPase n=1 Tax=Lentibacillus sp. CBA3610 TaxID=2518176 RepID=UPI001595C8A5|nr:AAA family ATPase [Lentibacillus sp. CBA3610]QKY69345.1 AAA family ATPase [Lentibacillus sp. CBA3610]